MLRFLLALVLGLGTTIGLTAFLILTGIDWQWAKFFNRHEILVWLAVPWVFIGMLVPVVLLLFQYRTLKRQNSEQAKIQLSRALGSFISTYLCMTLLKVFTNRVDMEPFEPLGEIDFSDAFRFGFMQCNSWWESLAEGWPSGHTMVAVGMATAMHPLIKSRFWKSVNLIYPFLIALSVSTAFHWISDAVSGAVMGVIIGRYFAKSTRIRVKLPST